MILLGKGAEGGHCPRKVWWEDIVNWKKRWKGDTVGRWGTGVEGRYCWGTAGGRGMLKKKG